MTGRRERTFKIDDTAGENGSLLEEGFETMLEKPEAGWWKTGCGWTGENSS